MCRIFGFRSVINSQVHSSLVEADNALADQSLRHPDGWGIAYYFEDTPHLVKSTDCAMDSHIFKKVSGVVSSHTVVAHIRKATQGDISLLNSHPFQFGKWVFAHNGNIRQFQQHRSRMLQEVDADLARFILGNTDSELFFFMLLSKIRKTHPLANPHIPLDKLFEAARETIEIIISIAGKLINTQTPVPTENYLTFIISTGPVMAAFHGGQNLNFCTHKTRCPDRDLCTSFTASCESPYGKDGHVNHLIFSSEKLAGHNVWNAIQPQEIVGIDRTMKIKRQILSGDFF